MSCGVLMGDAFNIKKFQESGSAHLAFEYGHIAGNGSFA
jgi:hypothetical protein